MKFIRIIALVFILETFYTMVMYRPIPKTKNSRKTRSNQIPERKLFFDDPDDLEHELNTIKNNTNDLKLQIKEKKRIIIRFY